MQERTQDAMTYVQHYGTPDLFITFTCNPAWDEVKKELFPGQVPKDRHDLLARVFHLKLKKLTELITKYEIFGAARCNMFTIEWQKRGLPHAHILIWLCEKIHANQVDSCISAELPNPSEDPILFEVIATQMIHDPCGALNPNSPCMKEGTCTKKYPRQFLQDTQTGFDGYPLYRRRRPENEGFTATKKIKGINVTVDNRWVVPYCPLLSKIFKAHINVEFCSSVKAIKYILKYIDKGPDAAMFSIEQNRDEITQYQQGRFISSNEAYWRTYSFPIHERYPAVVQLSVHLENGQRVYFTDESAIRQAQSPKDTKLTAFFKLCQEDSFASTLLYAELPKHYTWKSPTNKWDRRQKASNALARIYVVHPSQEECFFLRMLLHEVRGPKSFEDLRKWNGIVCATYREACYKRGLLEDDEHWNSTITEAAVSRSPKQLRRLFAIMLQTCGIGNPLQLWIIHRESLSEDFKRALQMQNPQAEVPYDDRIFNLTLIDLQNKVLSLAGRDLKYFGLPSPNITAESSIPRDIIREMSYDTNELSRYIADNEPKLLPDQAAALEKIEDSVSNGKGIMFYLDAPGGTGKTFVMSILLAKVRAKKRIAIAVASSGIAATLLPGGRTAHSTFKLSLNLASQEYPVCNVSRGSGIAQVLQQCRLIVWDECTMAHKGALEALDRSLRDLRNCDKPMGGTTLVLSGDFRQTLPVIPRGTRADEMKACLKSSNLWSKIAQLHLCTNMRARLQGDESADQFAKEVLHLGNGELPTDEHGNISLTQIGCTVESVEQLKEKVFPNLSSHFQDSKWLCQRAILAPKNDTVFKLNSDLLLLLPGSQCTYRSIDSVVEQANIVRYPIELLHSLTPPGTSSHILSLKVGAPIMLLRNLDPPKLCNGTRLVIKKLMPHVLEATVITGCATGEDVFIPRLPIIPTDFAFQFRRIQFPIQLSFAMSINKAQGQTLTVAGLHLLERCFSHGQLYVGCSRVGNRKNLYILAPDAKTHNIVYKEALR